MNTSPGPGRHRTPIGPDPDATGPEGIAAALHAAGKMAGAHAADLSAIGQAVADGAERYAALGMAPSTVAGLRHAEAWVRSAACHMTHAAEHLKEGLADFQARDGQVAAAVTSAGNLADATLVTETGEDMTNGTGTSSAEAHHRGTREQARDGLGRYASTVPDVLGVADAAQCFGSDQVQGVGDVPVNVLLWDFGEGGLLTPTWSWRGGQYVSVETPTGMPGSYNAPALAPDEAELAASHLEELADLAESGYRAPTQSKWSRAAHRLQHLVDQDDAGLDDPLGIGSSDEFPITVGELLQLLRDKDAADDTRRRVVAETCSAAGGDSGAMWMDLETGPDGTVVAVTGVEGTTDTPDINEWDQHTSRLTPADARELAAMLRTFATAARKRARR